MRAYLNLFLLLFIQLARGYVDVLAASLVPSQEKVDIIVTPQQFVPHVAFHCGHLNQYLHKNGSWVTDKDPHAQCLSGKLDILKYCRKVYPELQVTNIVEASHNFQISNWCALEGSPCKWNFWVKAYRCLVGEFENEALLVPEGCHFAHADDRKTCQAFRYWNRTAHAECSRRSDSAGSSLRLNSFSVIEPCGLDLFSGVEFVCCPRKRATSNKKQSEPMRKVKKPTTIDDELIIKATELVKPKKATKPDDLDLHVKATLTEKKSNTPHRLLADDDDEDDDDEEEDDDDDDVDNDIRTITTKKTPSSGATTTKKPLSDDDDDEDDDLDVIDKNEDRDPYFRAANPDEEHDRYTQAMKRVEKKHRVKVSKVMEEWSELETRYQEMKTKDPKHAEEFRKEMTSRFQKTVAALEAENKEEKRQIDEVHQQRVNAVLNERKRQAIQEYREALEMSKKATPKNHLILKTLQAYIRAEEKDRIHTLNRYRHMLSADPESARSERMTVIERLRNIDLRINGTIDMLRDVPGLQGKIKPIILEFWQTYRQENTPEVGENKILDIGTKKSDKQLLEIYQHEYEPRKESSSDESAEEDTTKLSVLVDREPKETDFDDDVIKARKSTTKKPISDDDDDDDDDEDEEDDEEDTTTRRGVDESVQTLEEEEDDEEDDDDELVEERAKAVHDVVDSLQSLRRKDALQHSESIHEISIPSEAEKYSTAYFVFGMVAIVLVLASVLTILLVRRRNSAKAQGFVAVDSTSPEERHVSNMQVNGYENPTYKHFEAV